MSSKIEVIIRFHETDGEVVESKISKPLSPSALLSIDSSERELLSVCYENMRQSLSNHLSHLSKKKGFEVEGEVSSSPG